MTRKRDIKLVDDICRKLKLPDDQRELLTGRLRIRDTRIKRFWKWQRKS